MHLRVNLIGIYVLTHTKDNNGTMFVTGWFQWQRRRI